MKQDSYLDGHLDLSLLVLMVNCAEFARGHGYWPQGSSLVTLTPNTPAIVRTNLVQTWLTTLNNFHTGLIVNFQNPCTLYPFSTVTHQTCPSLALCQPSRYGQKVTITDCNLASKKKKMYVWQITFLFNVRYFHTTQILKLSSGNCISTCSMFTLHVYY